MSNKIAPQFFDHIILGGGIVGLSIASQLSKFGENTLLIERRSKFLQETSTHNSGVVHSGLYYPKESLKTKLCIEGNRWLWDHNNNNNNNTIIDAKKCGKWIIATSQEEIPKLKSLKQALEERGMPSRWVSKKERNSTEPELECIECLESENTGIVDVHSLANYFEHKFLSENDGGIALFKTEINSMKIAADGSLQLELNDEAKTIVQSKTVINSTGLFASNVAQEIRLAANLSSTKFPERMVQKLCRGTYVTLSGKQLLHRLVYPCPLENLAGLGVHSVIDFANSSLLFGPNVEFLSEEETQNVILSKSHDSSRYLLPFSSSSKNKKEQDEFLDTVHSAVKRYLPKIEREKLRPAYCGIRPKLSGKGEAFRDFMIEIDQDVFEATRGELKVVNCLGIESPGLTASPAIGRYVVEDVLKKN